MSAQQSPHAWQAKAACRGPQAAVFFPPPQFERKDEKLELNVGENYQMKIIKLIPTERKIGLSIRALKNDEFRADWEAYTETTGRPEVTLGDHFKNR